MEACGLEQGNATLRAIVGTIESLKQFATPDASAKKDPAKVKGNETDETDDSNQADRNGGGMAMRLGLSYTINLVLPKTDDVSVFNAIFKSLRDNLLQR